MIINRWCSRKACDSLVGVDEPSSLRGGVCYRVRFVVSVSMRSLLRNFEGMGHAPLALRVCPASGTEHGVVEVDINKLLGHHGLGASVHGSLLRGQCRSGEGDTRRGTGTLIIMTAKSMYLLEKG